MSFFKHRFGRAALVAGVFLALVGGGFFVATDQAPADEGMWLFNQPPRKLLKERYDFEVTDAWLEHLQKSSVRFNSGGSGSFVSADGLVMTNHHVGADALQKLSTAEKDLLKDGFHAADRAAELKCVDLELNVLVSIEDVTEKINAAVKPEMTPGEAQQARRGAINSIEKESKDATGLRSDVVTLYQGGLYHLYRYKKYTDVRLVFAPEQSVAFFGGDPDNFEYPRFDLDVCFFRAYEDDKPAKVEHHLRWSEAGSADGDLIFVSGHPGRTSRLNTMAHLEFHRDVAFPATLDMLRRREVLLRTYSERSIENARRAKDELFGYQNSRKARLGGLGGLQDPAIMWGKQSAERKLRAAVAADPQLKEKYGDAWEKVDAGIAAYRKIFVRHGLLERGTAFDSHLFTIARTLVRMAEEDAKPNAERLREYGEAGRESLEQELFSTAPIYADLETVKLADSLSALMEQLGGGDELVIQILAGKSPAERAAELVSGSKLASVDVRKRLAEGGKAELEASVDPIIALAKLVDGPARALRKTFEEEIEEPLRQAYGKIAQARFAAAGTDVYPDATFTLRLAFGTVRGYEEGGKKLPPWTTIGGAFEHSIAHERKDPFELPERWWKAREKVKSDTPFNIVSTADIIGGNSGSPVVNRDGEVVGLIFDGNLASLVLDFVYTDERARATSVDARAIIESLRSVYDAGDLVKELLGKSE
jgi:hypothetical protein